MVGILIGSCSDNRISILGFMDQLVYFFGVVRPVHDIEKRSPGFMILSEKNENMSGIVDPVFRHRQSGKNLVFGIDSD